MKIVFLLQASSVFVKGGTELQADLIMGEILKAGHKVYCVSNMLKNPGPGRDGVEYIYLKSRGRRLTVLNFFTLMKVIKRINPDIIYQRYRVPYTGMAAWYTKKHKIHMVFNTANLRDPQKNPVELNHMFFFNYISEHLGRYGVKNASAIVVQTYEQMALLKKNFNRDCVVIRNGHPVPTPPFKKTSPPVVLWVSKVKHVKRLELFLDLAQKLKDTPARFVYIGRSPDTPYHNALNTRAKGLSNVEHLGELSYEQTNKQIAEASVLVNTSISEGYPNTFIQAWMRETPVVSLNVDPDDLLEKKRIGFCSGHFEQFVSDVKSLIEDKEKRKQIGKKSRQYAIENHNIEEIGKKFLDLFEQLVHKN